MRNATSLGTGALAMESLLYLYGLQHAAELAEYIGLRDLAEGYPAAQQEKEMTL